MTHTTPRRALTLALLVLAGSAAAQSVLVHDVRNFQNNEAMNGSRVLSVNASGQVQETWQNPRLKFTEGVTLTQGCLWSPNIGFNPNARRDGSLPQDIHETLTCLNRATGTPRDTHLKGFQSLHASATTDRKAVIVGSATTTELARVADSGATVRMNYSTFASGVVRSTLKTQGGYVHAAGRYAQVVGTQDGRTGLLVVDENTLRPLTLIKRPEFTMTSVFVRSGHLVIVGFDDDRRSRRLTVSPALTVTGNAAFPCADALGSRFFAATPSGTGLLGLTLDRTRVVECTLSGQQRVVTQYPAPVTKVVLKNRTLFAFGEMGSRTLLTSTLDRPAVRAVRVGDSIIDLQ